MDEREEKKIEIDFLTDEENYYLSTQKDIEYVECEELQPSDWALYHIEEITFEEKAPRKEALENFVSAMKIPGTNFIYLVLGDEDGVHFYYGVARNLAGKVRPELSARDIGKYILKTSVEGNFRGSKTNEVKPEQMQDVLARLDSMQFQSILEGVPGYNKEDDQFQGADRLADVMMGDTFAFMIIASPLDYSDVKAIEKNLFTVYDRLAPLAKVSIQEGKSANSAFTRGSTEGVSKSCSQNYSVTGQDGYTITENIGGGYNESVTSTYSYTASAQEGREGNSKSSQCTGGGSDSVQMSSSDGRSEAINTGGSLNISFGKTEGNTESTNTSYNKGLGTSSAKTIEVISKASQDWIKYFDEVIMPRLDYGMGKGVFITTSYFLADKKSVLTKLQNTVISLYSGEKGNKIPLRAFEIKDNRLRSYLMSFQLPVGKFKRSVSINEPISRSALSQHMDTTDDFVVGNWITTNELSVIAGLPRKEVVGLALIEEVEFGLNYALPMGADKNEDVSEKVVVDNKLSLGKLVQSGREINADVYLDRRNLNEHVFITGVTGSGKTTTCHSVLLKSKAHFLVIEPAKTEYRVLKNEEGYSDLLVFTLGNDGGTPFRLNPFEFFPHESITSRVDMIRASIEAAFDMEHAMPQLIEQAIYECYKDYGWNVSTNENIHYKNRLDAFKDGEFAFPILSDLVDKIDSVVADQGFSVRLRDDYLGSIKARLKGLLVGSKGLMLNTRRSVDFRELLNRNVVLELEEIKSGAEKSLVMGFILTNLMEAIKDGFNGETKLKHITLVEEAHRLLSKYEPGDSPNKKHGVETFTDMLAEIRKYGESLIVVDQIPNKMTPEVLKNTNTKIVHKIFATDDKEAIGNTIMLNEDQKRFLSNLTVGRAVIFTKGMDKSVQVQVGIATKKETTDNSGVKMEDLQETVYDFYCQSYSKGIIPNLQYCTSKKSARKMIKKMFAYSKEEYLAELIEFYVEREHKLPEDSQIAFFKSLLSDKERVCEVIEFMTTLPDPEAKERFPEIRAFFSEWKERCEIEYVSYMLILMYYTKKGKLTKKMLLKYREMWRNYIERFMTDDSFGIAEMKDIINDL